MINVKEVVPVNNKIPLLRRGYRAASEGSINVKRCSFGILWCIDKDVSYVIECTPIASKILYINLIIDLWKVRVVSREGKVLNDPSFGGIN